MGLVCFRFEFISQCTLYRSHLSNLLPQGTYSAIHVAAQNSNVSAIDLLVEHGADVNKATPENGMTAVWAASDHGRLPIVNALVRHQADVNIPKTLPGGFTCLHVACQNGHEQVGVHCCLHLLLGGFSCLHAPFR